MIRRVAARHPQPFQPAWLETHTFPTRNMTHITSSAQESGLDAYLDGLAKLSGSSMPTNAGTTANAKRAECLRSERPDWKVSIESTKMFVKKMKKPDIVVSHERGLTVVVETECATANTVESDVQTRLGRQSNSPKKRLSTLSKSSARHHSDRSSRKALILQYGQLAVPSRSSQLKETRGYLTALERWSKNGWL